MEKVFKKGNLEIMQLGKPPSKKLLNFALIYYFIDDPCEEQKKYYK